MTTIRATMAQALVRYLAAQRVERDGEVQPFFAGMFGIFGHGNVTGMGQALEEHRDLLRYYRPQNEQAMVHTAAAYAKMKNRLATFACTSSVGPGATNMVTGAALATVNRLPVLSAAAPLEAPLPAEFAADLAFLQIWGVVQFATLLAAYLLSVYRWKMRGLDRRNSGGKAAHLRGGSL